MKFPWVSRKDYELSLEREKRELAEGQLWGARWDRADEDRKKAVDALCALRGGHTRKRVLDRPSVRRLTRERINEMMSYTRYTSNWWEEDSE